LAGNETLRGKRIRPSLNAGSDATVLARDQDSAFLIDLKIHEIEEISAGAAAADSAALDWIAGGNVLRRPSFAPVKSS
jgi:hypothetical protein